MALYSQDFLERVRSANELSQVIGGYNIHLKRVGLNLVGLCPFHNEKTPSFNVRTTEQYFRCFGCDAKGDVFRFIELMEKVEFPEAVKMLAERSGIPLEYTDPGAAREAAAKSRAKGALLWCCSRALDYFEENLAKPDGAPALAYLLSRGFERETIRRWRLGWAPEEWDGLCGFLLKNAKEPGQKEKVLEYAFQAGLVRAKEDERRGGRRYYDAFRGRVMFPILDSQSNPVAFGGRVLEEKPEAGGKYINSPEGRLFEKRKVLFGLPQAAKEIALSGEAVVVEGYTDAIMCHQYGIRNVVATLGTALTEDHIALLRRQVAGRGRVVAFFDADAAGEKATRRAIGLFMSQDLPLAVAGDLELKDAGAFLPKYGAEEFRKKLARAEDAFDFLLKRTLGRANRADLSAVGLAVREAMETVNLCPDPVKLALMRQRVAAAAGVPEDTLPRPAVKGRGTIQSAPGGTLRPRPRMPARPAAKPGLEPPAAGLAMREALERGEAAVRNREARLLRYLWENREWCAQALDAYPPDDWRNSALAELAERIRDVWEENETLSLAAVRAGLENPEAMERLADFAFPDAEPLSAKELARLLQLLGEEGVRERMRELMQAMAEARRGGDAAREGDLLAEYARLQTILKKK